ncbi:hypothetical protein COLO4_20566 [Corchorus olitorius]|uniref:Uncharacterized protein n=1 Tax=Corchorus olitorius TaxID=93759 RepID=A0A1R3IZ20_9ROSI|nr:hypothetical protein COLO4_20566 [Corchorus olitorius]
MDRGHHHHQTHHGRNDEPSSYQQHNQSGYATSGHVTTGHVGHGSSAEYATMGHGNVPSTTHHTSHSDLGELASKPTFKVYCKADPHLLLTVRDGKVVLAPAAHSDPNQQWYKDEKFSNQVKDSAGFPSFSLVNKATGQAIKHANGASQPDARDMEHASEFQKLYRAC